MYKYVYVYKQGSIQKSAGGENCPLLQSFCQLFSIVYIYCLRVNHFQMFPPDVNFNQNPVYIYAHTLDTYTYMHAFI